MLNYGVLLYFGDGVKSDKKEAKKYLSALIIKTLFDYYNQFILYCILKMKTK